MMQIVIASEIVVYGRREKKTIAHPRMSVRPRDDREEETMAGPNGITHDNPELRDVSPGFPGSAPGLCDMTDATMAAVPDEIMSIQADEACGAEYGARSDRRADSRNGYRSRRLDTTVGTLDLRIPKPGSGSCLPTDLPGRYSRTDRALAAAVAETCAAGTPARKAGRVAAKFGVESPPRDQVSRLCAVADGEVDAFLARDWSAMRLDCLLPGATYAGCRVSGRVRSEALVTAIGVGDDGRKHFVGLACANAESYASWRGLPRDPGGRGVRDVRLVTSDAHDGLAGAIREACPEATWQRRVVRARRDVLAKIDGRGTGAAPAPSCPPSSVLIEPKQEPRRLVGGRPVAPPRRPEAVGVGVVAHQAPRRRAEHAAAAALGESRDPAQPLAHPLARVVPGPGDAPRARHRRGSARDPARLVPHDLLRTYGRHPSPPEVPHNRMQRHVP